MGRDFSTLERHARREYKFAQRDSNGLINQETMLANYSDKLAHGVCMGVVLNWIKEKLSTSNSLVRRDGRLLSTSSKRFANPINPISRLSAGISPAKGSVLEKFLDKGKSGVRNQTTMLSGAMTQSAYISGGSSGRSSVARELGLQPSSYVPEGLTQIDPENASIYKPLRVADASIAAAGTGLPKGNAVLIEIDQIKGAGHAIAFYRSRGGVLYFFDPNAGVYSIFESQPTELLTFVKAWLAVYVENDGIKWKTSSDDWYASFNR
jgi:hypothetical protein